MTLMRLTSSGPVAVRPELAEWARRFRSSAAWQRAQRAQLAGQPWCSRCGATEDLTVDHIVPLSHGGHPTAAWNLDTLCRAENSGKDSSW